jgi:hypothetical protein
LLIFQIAARSKRAASRQTKNRYRLVCLVFRQNFAAAQINLIIRRRAPLKISITSFDFSLSEILPNAKFLINSDIFHIIFSRSNAASSVFIVTSA